MSRAQFLTGFQFWKIYRCANFEIKQNCGLQQKKFGRTCREVHARPLNPWIMPGVNHTIAVIPNSAGLLSSLDETSFGGVGRPVPHQEQIGVMASLSMVFTPAFDSCPE
jgi:hypothetical protein